MVIRPANDGFIITPQVVSSSVSSPVSISSPQRTLISDGVTTVYSTLAPAPSREQQQAVVTRSRVFVTEEAEEEDTSDEGFPGVALVTQLPRFNLESKETQPSSLSEEEEDVVSSEAFR